MTMPMVMLIVAVDKYKAEKGYMDQTMTTCSVALSRRTVEKPFCALLSTIALGIDSRHCTGCGTMYHAFAAEDLHQMIADCQRAVMRGL
jgi:hypothetical protein